jgi:hypothetical protein
MKTAATPATSGNEPHAIASIIGNPNPSSNFIHFIVRVF